MCRDDVCGDPKQIAPSISQEYILEIEAMAVAQRGNDHMKILITYIQPSFLNSVQVRNIKIASISIFSTVQVLLPISKCLIFETYVPLSCSLLAVSLYITVIKARRK
jgi:hypothetical protein